MTRALQVIHGSDNYPKPPQGAVVTIGNFDGVHCGHQALIQRAKELGSSLGKPVCVYTFDPPPRRVMAPRLNVPMVQRLSDKLERLGKLGVDQVVVEPFTREFASYTAAGFASEILMGRLGASAVVVGWDFRFGKGRSGDAEGLRKELPVPVTQVQAVRMEGDVVSSTRIRRLVSEGEVGLAARLLGRGHRVVGAVVKGDAIGRTLGFPTANIVPETELVPSSGVYAVRTKVPGGDWIDGVANLGTRPTFGGLEERFEVHLLDYGADLYDQELTVSFVEKVREERRFSGPEELVAQIGRDVGEARRILGDAGGN